MIVVASLGHRPDDERIYHREIRTLKTLGRPITYLTRSAVRVDLSDDLVTHINFPDLDRASFLTAVKENLPAFVAVFHFHEFELLPLARWFKRRGSTFTLYDVHEYMREMWGTHSRRSRPVKTIINRGLSWYERYYLRYVDHIIFANNMVAGNPYPSHSGRLTLLENFPLKSRIMTGNHRHRLVYHGQMSPERGTEILLQAYEILYEGDSTLELSLIGPAESDAYQRHLRDRVADSPAKAGIVLETEIPHEEIWPRITQAAIGLIPFLSSPLTEANTPTKLFEYMAAGCAVVASDVRPLRLSGLDWLPLVEPGNPRALAAVCRDLLQQPDVLQTQVRKNQEWIRTGGNWETVQNRLLEIYRAALS
ncbi:MAG: glycosyltransferase family 4 protein [Fidelibacterota bacterium]